MSENLDDLLDIADEENEGDYDLADDEEEALLDENYDISNKTPSTTLNNVQTTTETEQDVLDLDDETELHDEENENVKSTEEDTRCRNKFSSERIVPQQEQQIFVKQFTLKKNIQSKQNFRGGFHNATNRGNRIGNRGNFHNNQNRATQYQQRNKVLINPHFKGNVQIKHNVSLAWDKNNANTNHVGFKKPVIHIQPWAHQQNQEMVPYQQSTIRQDICINQQYQLPPVQNSRLPVHQRLGINSNIYNQSLPDNQYIQNPPQPTYQQAIPQNQYSQPPVFNQTQFANNYNNNMNQFAQPMYNNINKPPINPPFQGQCVYPVSQGQPMPHVTYNPNQNYSDYHLQNIQPEYVQNFNNPVPNMVNYPPNFPVISNETLNVDVPYFEEPEQKFQPMRKFSLGSPGKRKFDYKQDLKKKKRTVLSSNLHEVQTVDVKVFEDRNNFFQEEDEETRLYRKKIEHQKRMREKLLKTKEERRKIAAKQLQAEETHNSLQSPNDIVKEEIPVIAHANKLIKGPVTQVVKPKFVCVNKTIIPNTIPFETASTKTSESETLNKDQLTSFLSNRKIFAKDKSLIDTSLVVVKNLATGTSEVKLRKLCQGVGDIQVRVVKPNRT